MMETGLGLGFGGGLGCMGAPTRNAEDVQKLVELFKANDVAVTEELVLKVSEIVYGYFDFGKLAEVIQQSLENAKEKKENDTH